MNKFEEIIEKLKASKTTVDIFAHQQAPYPDVFSDTALEAQRLKDEWIKNNPRPLYRSEEFKKWEKEYSELPSKYDVAFKEWKKDNNLPDWIEIDRYGGEDMGSTWYSIKYFPELDLYIKVSGWYQSYNGVEFEDWEQACKEVRPTEKTITVYE